MVEIVSLCLRIESLSDPLNLLYYVDNTNRVSFVNHFQSLKHQITNLHVVDLALTDLSLEPRKCNFTH